MRFIAALIVGSVLLVAGCAGSMMGDKEMMKKEGDMMKDDKGSMDKK